MLKPSMKIALVKEALKQMEAYTKSKKDKQEDKK